MRYIYTVEYHSPLKRKAIGSFAEMWKALDTVIQTEVSQKEKNKYRMYITHICGIQKTGIKDPICKAEMETQMQKTNVLTFLCFERRKLSTICPRSTQNSSSMKQCLNSCPSYPSSLRRNVFLTCREERVSIYLLFMTTIQFYSHHFISLAAISHSYIVLASIQLCFRGLILFLTAKSLQVVNNKGEN